MKLMVKKRDLSMISHLRQNGRITLTELSKRTGIPISTAYERLKSLQASGLIQLTALLDFALLGLSARTMISLKVDSNIRSQVGEYLAKHWNVNTVLRVNNGFTFIIDAVFRDMREAEEWIEDLGNRFRLRKKTVSYVMEELKREGFLRDPTTADIVLGGDQNG